MKTKKNYVQINFIINPKQLQILVRERHTPVQLHEGPAERDPEDQPRLCALRQHGLDRLCPAQRVYRG